MNAHIKCVQFEYPKLKWLVRCGTIFGVALQIKYVFVLRVRRIAEIEWDEICCTTPSRPEDLCEGIDMRKAVVAGESI